MSDTKVDLLGAVASDISQISADILEAGFDQLFKDGFLKDIPFFGIGFKVYALLQNASGFFFTKKLLKFLFQLKDISEQQRKDFVEKLEKEQSARKAGEVVLFVLSRLDDVDKATIIGNLLRAVILENISFSMFTRLANIVDKVFLEDLIKLKDNDSLLGIDNTTLLSLSQAGALDQLIRDGRAEEESRNKRTGRSGYRESTFGYRYKLNEFGRLIIMHGL